MRAYIRITPTTSGSVITGYHAYTESYTHYYPFGMVMPGRSYNSGEYRFGFNGQEKINEIYGSGNYIDFMFRGYNPRLGRFFTVDPLFKKYPQWSSYQFSGNQVTSSKELEGAEPQVDLNAKATATYTFGTNRQSNFRFSGSFGVSLVGDNVQGNLNISGSLYS
ncbi:MAG: hypothetical protein RMJ53_10560, partial [Chitinophagales bacterium]|nr:hypothetical protein [Chitinophagales bacterium]